MAGSGGVLYTEGFPEFLFQGFCGRNVRMAQYKVMLYQSLAVIKTIHTTLLNYYEFYKLLSQGFFIQDQSSESYKTAQN
jgi:hypothetical protein